MVFFFSWDFAFRLRFLPGVSVASFLTRPSEGKDQLMVQRLFPCRDQRDSQKALVFSGFVVLFQFALFLLIGVMLFVYYKFFPLATNLTSNDQIFPTFIVERLS